MDFFAEQEGARRRSRRLVVLFVAAVAAIVVAVYLATSLLLVGISAKTGAAESPFPWDRDRFLLVAAAVLLVVTGGSLYKTTTLRRGGAALAELLGGRRLDPASTDADERRLLNVVEEMALASGVPVPTVYVLQNETTINAFAAGFSPSDAVIGVTRGSVRRLSRQELQGVVAHEFSHLLNGDMRLNLRLVGLLHGILVIALIGEILLRTLRVRGSSRGKKGGAWPIVLFGLALYLIGWIGVFFGRWIRAGVSRQREFLADASAVQFTRDPQGIAGALRKIGAAGVGSVLRANQVEQASHFLFADGVTKRWFAPFATHPPLVDRIRRVDPSWDGRWPKVEPLDGPDAAERPKPGATPVEKVGRVVAVAAAAVAAGEASRRAGQVGRRELELAREIVEAIPDDVRRHAREPLGAQALVAVLLLDADSEVRAAQLARIDGEPPPGLSALVREIDSSLPADRTALRIPLLDLALPALRTLSPAQYRRLRELVEWLVAADQEVSIFELVLERALLRHLGPHFGEASPARVDTYSLAGRLDEVSRLLSALARSTQPGAEAAEASFAAGAALLASHGLRPRLLSPDEQSTARLGEALDALSRVALPWKRRLLDAAAAVAAHDGRLDPEEAELLRAIADGLGVPLPPIASGARPASTSA